MKFEGSIIRKFNQLSSKEWLQYFQFKLSPEREKELIDYSQYDPFLKDALDSFNDQSLRPVALQSYNYLLNNIRNQNGDSTLNSNISRSSNSAIDYKKILLILGLLIGIVGIGFLIKYTVDSFNSEDNSMEEDATAIEAVETADITNSDINAPIETIPNSAPLHSQTSEGTTSSSGNNNQNISTNTSSSQSNTNSSSVINTQMAEENLTEVPVETPATVQSNNSAISFDKENRLFQKAQQLYTQGKYNESKQILQSLSSYDNPKRAQAKKILNNLQ